MTTDPATASGGSPPARLAAAARGIDLGAHSGLVAVALWVYACIAALWELWSPRLTLPFALHGSWEAVPADVVLLAIILALLHRMQPRGARHLGWWLLLACIAIDLAVSLAWPDAGSAGAAVGRAITDGVYQCYYLLMSAACAAFFVSCGGSFMRRSTWIDAITLLVGALAASWAFLYGFPAPGGPGYSMGTATKLAYTLGLSINFTVTALLFMQIVNWRRSHAIRWLLAASIVGVLADFVWLAADAGGAAILRPASTFGNSVSDVGDLVFCACLASAVAAERRWPLEAADEPARSRDPYSFLPALALLLALALLIGSEATVRGLDERVLVAMVLVGAVLAVARQQTVHRELQRLSAALVAREVDVRLTELARSAADILAVMGDDGRLSFVSPAAGTMLGRVPAQLQGTPAAGLLGPANEAAMTALIRRGSATAASVAELDATVVTDRGTAVVVHVICRNQLSNPSIRGIVLTVSDVTEQRALQHSLIAIAARERRRLARELHEGLGQELAGVSLLLQGLVTQRERDPQWVRREIGTVLEHVRSAVGRARELATNAAPLGVARDSLSEALEGLARHAGGAAAVELRIDGQIDDDAVTAEAAEHLYRIAEEAVQNALRHSGCRTVVITLRAIAGLTLSVADDGRGMNPPDVRPGGLGLRMMEYRAQLLGAPLQIESLAAGGTRVSITVRGGQRPPVAPG